jgi:2-phospho-L-lactate guanylyltransferase
MGIWAVIPARAPDEGKSRLASVLSPDERRRLNEAFFRRTLAIVAAAAGRRRTVVVTRSDQLLQIARNLGVAAVRERSHGDLNAALAQAAEHARARGASGVLSISCDLPWLTAADVRALLAAAGRSRVVIAGDRAGLGTNALVMAPPAAMPYQYGGGSFRAHVAAARRRGLAVRVLRRRGLAFDVDTPADLQVLRRQG